MQVLSPFSKCSVLPIGVDITPTSVNYNRKYKTTAFQLSNTTGNTIVIPPNSLIGKLEVCSDNYVSSYDNLIIQSAHMNDESHKSKINWDQVNLDPGESNKLENCLSIILSCLRMIIWTLVS